MHIIFAVPYQSKHGLITVVYMNFLGSFMYVFEAF
jgi:hypothetical protein